MILSFPVKILVKRIVKYLKERKDAGIKMKANTEFRFKACADSDFSNGYDKLNPEDYSTLFPYTSFIMYLCRIPLIQSSKLQIRLTLYSIKVEYVALFIYLRDMILVMNLVDRISRIVQLEEVKFNIKSTVINNNKEAFKIVKTLSLTLR